MVFLIPLAPRGFSLFTEKAVGARMQSAQSLNRVKLVPRALFRHLQCQGKAPWERGWNRVFLLVLFSFDRVLKKKIEARLCLTKATFTPCRLAIRANTKSSKILRWGFSPLIRAGLHSFCCHNVIFFRTSHFVGFFLALEPRKLTRWDVHKYARQAYDLGVRYIGGCCGFEPYHIRAIAEEVGTE